MFGPVGGELLFKQFRVQRMAMSNASTSSERVLDFGRTRVNMAVAFNVN